VTPSVTAHRRSGRRRSYPVGIWHETYLSRYAETVSVNTPELGLAKFTELVPLSRTKPLSE
jgi:hypothetical protein